MHENTDLINEIKNYQCGHTPGGPDGDKKENLASGDKSSPGGRSALKLPQP